MNNCKFLSDVYDKDTQRPMYKCSKNNVEDKDFEKIKSAFEASFSGHVFVPNGECTYRFNTEDIKICPCFKKREE